MDPGEIVWEEPPPATERTVKRGRYVAIADQLREHPKRWARIYLGKKSSAYSVAATLTHNRRKGFYEGQWEAVARCLGEDADTDWAVYVRYLGDDEEA